MRIGINCGHTQKGLPGAGAVGYLCESDETRAVGYKLMEHLRKAGVEVYDCTNDIASSTSTNLQNIVSLANSISVDAFISIHFNAGGGKGTEVYTNNALNVAFANKMRSALINLGFKDRGLRSGNNLYVIRHTNAPAALVEVCFVDNKEDAELYKKLGAEKVAAALARAILGNGNINDLNGGLDMTEYEELKQEIKALRKTVDEIDLQLHYATHPMIYNFIDENMPEWARPTIQKLVDKGYLKGGNDGLDLTDDLLRILVINDRAGIYD